MDKLKLVLICGVIVIAIIIITINMVIYQAEKEVVSAVPGKIIEEQVVEIKREDAVKPQEAPPMAIPSAEELSN